VLRKKHADGAAWLCDRRMTSAREDDHFIVHNQLVIVTAGSLDMRRSKRRHIIDRRSNTTRDLRLSGAAFAPHELTRADFVLIPTPRIVSNVNADRCNEQ
jgi:hypothetical protein